MDVLQVLAVLAAIAAGAGAIASAIVAWRVHKASTAPEVVAYIDRYDTSVLWFVLQNIGNGVAYDVEFDSGELPSREELIRAKFEAFRDFGVPMLMPGQARRVPVFETAGSINAEARSYPVDVSFASEHGGKKTTVTYYLDYKSFSETLWTDANETLIRRSLQSIDKTLKNEAQVNRIMRTMPPATHR